MSAPKTPLVLHLETDASAIQESARSRPDGMREVLGGAGVVLRAATLDPVYVAKGELDAGGFIGGVVACYAISLGYVRSSYHAEFLAFELGMMKAKEHGAKGLLARSDLEGLVKGINGEWQLRAAEVKTIAARIGLLKREFDPFVLRWAKGTHDLQGKDGVPSADTLAKLGSGFLPRGQAPAGVRFESADAR